MKNQWEKRWRKKNSLTYMIYYFVDKLIYGRRYFRIGFRINKSWFNWIYLLIIQSVKVIIERSIYITYLLNIIKYLTMNGSYNYYSVERLNCIYIVDVYLKHKKYNKKSDQLIDWLNDQKCACDCLIELNKDTLLYLWDFLIRRNVWFRKFFRMWKGCHNVSFVTNSHNDYLWHLFFL